MDPNTNKALCEYLHNGQGIEYLVLAGTYFIIVFTVSGVILGYLADQLHRPRLMAACTLLFSVCGAVMGFATEYWHLVILRVGIAAGEAALRPATSSLFMELFDQSTRGQANGIFSWGIYIGYGLTFTLGNYVAPADILGYGWRSAFVIGCSPGVIIAIFMYFLKDPRSERGQCCIEKADIGRKDQAVTTNEKADQVPKRPPNYWRVVLVSFLQPAMLLLFVAATVRQAAGLTWALNTQLYLEEYYPDYNPGLWLTMCSIFGGSFGVFFGGYLSDMLVKKLGLHSRLWVLAGTTVIINIHYIISTQSCIISMFITTSDSGLPHEHCCTISGATLCVCLPAHLLHAG